MAFGLRMREVPQARDRARASTAALAQVELTGLEERTPGQLSGGQQQRVALARALVIEPPVLLCDEPLGALDRKLRQQMQFELKELQKRLGVTLVFVTHDQEEALAMSDRIAVMNAGPRRAGRRADRDLRTAAHALRRRLHRRDQYPGGGGPGAARFRPETTACVAAGRCARRRAPSRPAISWAVRRLYRDPRRRRSPRSSCARPIAGEGAYRVDAGERSAIAWSMRPMR